MYLDPTTEDWRIIQGYDDLRIEVQSLDDDSLVEECEEAYNFYTDEEIGELLLSYWKLSTFFPQDREKLENYYILVHSKLLYKE